jgi:hypothetical protein
MASKQATSRRASFHVPAQQRKAYLPGQIAVKFKPDIVQRAMLGMPGRRAFAFAADAALPGEINQAISWLIHNAGLREIRAPFVSGTAADSSTMKVAFALGVRRRARSKEEVASANAVMSVTDSPHEDLRGYTIAHIDPRVDVERLAKEMESRSVAFASPVAARWMLGAAAPEFRLHGTPQWALDCTGFRDVKSPKRGRKVRIAVLDTGIDLRHPDLKGVDVEYDHGPMREEDLEGHGTHVAGIISAIAARASGVSGVAQCDLDVWKVFSDSKVDGVRYVDSELYNRALGLALDSGCQVVNLSLGGTVKDRFEKELIERLIKKGVTVVAAMGNEFEEGNPIEYPAALKRVIAVGGIDQDHRRASFSNTGKHICIVAPAVAIRSTIPLAANSRTARYADWDGTSFAAPLVSGAIGYLMSHGILPLKAKPDKVRAHLRRRAVRLPEMRGKPFTREFGYGVIDFPRLSKR